MVLGIISEIKRIKSVITAENRPNQAFPNTTVALAPAPMAPTVCAIVLSVKMAASDLSTLSCLSRFKSAAYLGRFSFCPWIYEGVMLKSTDSAIEQRNEKTNASKT